MRDETGTPGSATAVLDPACVAARTPPNGVPRVNRLIHESSPYLRQHAHNPVDWYPWSAEAFDRARTENKPIFLSIGYSACHWCHVMARESFEDEEVARILNAHFVAIKVDREERPDVDRVYMTFVQATTGSGGWPMSVWLTPELDPFYGGTYYPPADHAGRPGFASVLRQIAEAWQKDPQRLAASGREIIRQLRLATAVRGGGETQPWRSVLDLGYRAIKASYDTWFGGFGGAPKFPRPVTLNFLLRYHAGARRDPAGQDALEMALFTLRKMAAGGLHDHIGGGFHRYAVDASWHVPHFEKMLYDQAQLACAYLEAGQITQDGGYADTARDILEYVLRDLTGARGQFFSAEDADSPRPGHPDEHAEGAFYVWEHDEIRRALGEDAAVFNAYYGVETNGNVRNDPEGVFRNRNILMVRHTLEETAQTTGRSAADLRGALARARAVLFAIRAQRPRPHRDDKTITAWNGLMISAFARAAQALNEPRYRLAAEAAARFIAAHLYDPKNGTLLRRHRAGQSAIAGFADDYAFLIQALLDLHDTTHDADHLTWAVALQNRQRELFWDEESGGFFSTAGPDSSLPLRLKEADDGAEPSPNSVAVLNLVRLSRLTTDARLLRMAEQTLGAFQGRLQQAPEALPQMLAAVLDYLASSLSDVAL